MIEAERQAVAVDGAVQATVDALAEVRAFESPACIKDKDDTIIRERAFTDNALLTILWCLLPWLQSATGTGAPSTEPEHLPAATPAVPPASVIEEPGNEHV
jgi:hypothetical protein